MTERVAAWRVVCAKELRETLRDRRTLLMMIVVPVLLYPVLLIVMEQLFLFGLRNLEAEAAPVALVGDAPPLLLRLVEADSALRVVPIDGPPEEAMRSDSVAAVAVFGATGGEDGSRSVTLLYDATSDRSNRARGELRSLLDAWSDSLLLGRLEARGLSPDFARPLALAE